MGEEEESDHENPTDSDLTNVEDKFNAEITAYEDSLRDDSINETVNTTTDEIPFGNIESKVFL